jgi:hypothetical protein
MYSRFDNSYLTGDGHFVLFGYSRVYQGMVQFKLRKIEKGYLQEPGAGSNLAFDDIDQCSELIHAILRARGGVRLKRALRHS